MGLFRKSFPLYTWSYHQLRVLRASFRAVAWSLSRFMNSLCRGAASRDAFLFADLFCSTYDICCAPLSTVRDPVVRCATGNFTEPKSFDVTVPGRSPSPPRTSEPRSASLSLACKTEV